MQRRQFLIDKMIQNQKNAEAQESMIDKMILDKKKDDINNIDNLSAKTDNVYFNVSITNKTNSDSQLATYETQFSPPLLKIPSDYWVSVIRFTVPLQEIPFFIWPNLGGTPSQVTDFSITISYKNTDYMTYLSYVPYYTSETSSTSEAGNYVFNYQQLFDSMNNAYLSSFNALYASLSAYNGSTTYALGDMITYNNNAYISLRNGNIGNTPNIGSLAWSVVLAPYVTFNAVTQLVQINVSAGFLWFSSIPLPENQILKLWMNSNLFNRFTNFNVIINNVTDPNGKHFLNVIRNYGSNIINLDLYGTITGYALTQEFPALYNLDDFRKLVITSSSLKIRNETSDDNSNGPTGASIYYASGVGTLSGRIPILTDFEIDLQNGPEVRSYAYYVPTAEYRLIDLLGNEPLVTLDLTIYWQDKLGGLHRLYIPPQNSADVKLLFRRRKIFS